MDPLSITGTILSMTARCLTTAKALGDLRSKYKGAQITISAICSESTVISASLSHIQSLVLQDPNPLSTQLKFRPELETAFDTALTGCIVVFSVLDDEVQKLISGGAGGSAELGFVAKARYLWNEETMKELLQQIRGQQTAITLLIQALQMESLSDIHTLLRNNNDMLEQVARRTVSLRESHPKLRAPQSIFDAAIHDVGSIYSDAASTAGATEFEFDDLVVNSKVYRRAFAGAYLRMPAKHRQDDDSDNEIIRKRQETVDATCDSGDTRVASENGNPNGNVPARDDTYTIVIAGEDVAETSTHSRASQMSEADVEKLISDHETLRDKYYNAKIEYFDRARHVERLQSVPYHLSVNKLKREKENLQSRCDELQVKLNEEVEFAASVKHISDSKHQKLPRIYENWRQNDKLERLQAAARATQRFWLPKPRQLPSYTNVDYYGSQHSGQLPTESILVELGTMGGIHELEG